jgi:hypothetical protein
MAEKIFFNGHVYHSVAEMPPDVRDLYERLYQIFQDADRDGVPDIFQQGGLKGIKEAVGFVGDLSKMGQMSGDWTPNQLAIINVSDTVITVNGKSFRSVDEMPPDVRQIYEQVVGEADPSSVEIFDEPWRERDRDSYFIPHDDEHIEPAYRLAGSSNVIQPVSSNLGLILAIGVGVVLCIALGVYLWLTTVP